MISTKVHALSLTSWLTDLRKIALINCIASSLPILLWNSTPTWIALESLHPLLKLWIVPIQIFVYVIAAIMPVFYFALFRNEGTLHISKRLRLLALAGAITFGVLVMADLFQWIRTRMIAPLAIMLAEVSIIAYVLLLISIFRKPNDPRESHIPISRLFRFLTKVAVIAFGLILIGVLLGLVLTPFSFFQLRDYALRTGRTTPVLGAMLARQIRSVLEEASWLAVPYIIYRSQRNVSPVDGQSGPELIESSG